MSIYSGFPTRSLESAYNSCLFEIINLLQTLIIDYFRSKQSQESPTWYKIFNTTFAKLSKLEKQKHLQPNFSDALKDLDAYIRSLNTHTIYEKTFEKVNLANPSVTSLGKVEIDRKTMRNTRYSSLHTKKSPRSPTTRESNYSIYVKHESGTKRNQMKSYQDQIFISILKDLSDPLQGLSNF